MVGSLGAVVACIALLAVVAFKLLYDNVLRPRWFLRHLPRPKSLSFITGNMNELLQQEPSSAARRWHSKFGHIVLFEGFFKSPRISITDPRALHHVLIAEPYKYTKPQFIRQLLALLLGEGLVVVEGEDHQRQRRIMNHSFGPAQIKSLYPVMMEKSHQLRDFILQTLRTSSAPSNPLDIYDLAGRATLDVIGSAGFGYEINAIERGNGGNELSASFRALFSSVVEVKPLEIIVTTVPILRYLVPGWSYRFAAMTRATATMQRIGDQLVNQKKSDALNLATPVYRSSIQGKPNNETSQLEGSKDLLSILVQANMATGLKPSQKLSDKEVAAQISTFLLAGNDTTGNAITWGIYGLCKFPSTQRALRTELVEASHTLGESPSFEGLNALPYLDAVVRETLRLYAPAMGTSRVATQDCVLPLAEPFVDTAGVKHDKLFVPRNTTVFVPIGHMQTNRAVWGSDALEFRPERWLPENSSLLPEGVYEIPSIAFPTFLAGARGCIGFRFTLAEMKLIFYDLIRLMSFELAVPPQEVEARADIVNRPRVASRPNEGWQLPVLVTLIDPN